METPDPYSVGKNPFRIGVSYWPRVAALNLWTQFDVDEVHEDFAVMAELGVNLARVSLRWRDFQPTPNAVRCAALSHLLKLCDAAAAEGVRLELLMLAGRIGDTSTYPDWLRSNVNSTQEGPPSSCGLVNPFSNELARSAAVTLVRAVAKTVGDHPAIWAYNLGDRPDRLAPDCCRNAASTWFDELRTAIHAVDTNHPVTCSLGSSNLSTNTNLRVDEVFSMLDHSTIDPVGLANHLGASDPEAEAVFGCALATALTGKRCLLQERAPIPDSVQQPETARSSEAQANCTSTMLSGLHRAGALGVVMGSYSDMPSTSDDGLGGLGLLDDSGDLRPHALAIRDFANSKPEVKLAPGTLLELGVSGDEYYSQPGTHVRRLWQEFLTRSVAG